MKKFFLCLATVILLSLPVAATTAENEAALTAATTWLENGGHTASAVALQEYLESCGITGKPMVYAVQHCGEDWYENAARVGSSSVNELRSLNFTLTQAFYGAGLQDYKGNAADALRDGITIEVLPLTEKLTHTPKETTETIETTVHIPTLGEKNALATAESYISHGHGWSESGLKEQLKYEGFTSTEAQYGVDNCKADWYEQADLKAASYMKHNSFSKEKLIEQLEYEGFTYAQAVHGATSVGY